jgi:hypothetical protein
MNIRFFTEIIGSPWKQMFSRFGLDAALLAFNGNTGITDGISVLSPTQTELKLLPA